MAQVEPRGREGPLAEVDVLVPEAGRQPASLGVVRRLAPVGGQARADLGDPPVGDADVDGSRHVLRDGDEAGVADQHAPTVGGGAPRSADAPAPGRG